MTVPYMRDVLTSGLLTFNKLLLKWKGSVWKNIWKELYIWLILYLSISGVYRFILRGKESGEMFEDFVVFCDKFSPDASLMFILGFYVTLVANRWWSIYQRIPWPDSTALLIATLLKNDPKTRETDKVIRHTLVRYLLLAMVLVFRDISESIKLRFPTMQHLVEYNLLTAEELSRLNAVKAKKKCKYWMPLQWICTMLRKCHEKEKIKEAHLVYLIENVLNYRTKLNDLLSYDWVGIPLVYTQVVNLAVLAYFSTCLFSRQFIGTNRFPTEQTKWEQDYVIPFFTILQFILYVGWLKVAQMMINPFGMDDDDFECNFLIERNKQITNIIVDQMYGDLPKLVDTFHDLPQELPHTVASRKFATNPMVGSVAKMTVTPRQQVVLSAETVADIVDHSRRNSDEMLSPNPTPSNTHSSTRLSRKPLLSPEHDLAPPGPDSHNTFITQPNNTNTTALESMEIASAKPSVSNSPAVVFSETQVASVLSQPSVATQVPSTLTSTTQAQSAISSTTQTSSTVTSKTQARSTASSTTQAPSAATSTTQVPSKVSSASATQVPSTVSLRTQGSLSTEGSQQSTE